MENFQRIAYLFHRSRKSELTVEEKVELDAWLDLKGENRAFYEREVIQGATITEGLKIGYEMDEARIERRIRSYRRASVTKPFSRNFLVRRSIAAAAVLSAIGLGLWFWNYNPNRKLKSKEENQQVLASAIAPGKNRAVLTLSDNTVVDLDSAAEGQVAAQAGARIVKTKNGLLQYQASPNGSAGEANNDQTIFNTLRTPIAGQFQLVLPDGTKVWLNNASQLRYPVDFIGKERLVELTGEGYFEVAGDPSKPFVVKVGDQTIRVLGTIFNITAYPEDPTIRTVLVEGTVKVNLGSQSVVLKPGRQTENIGAVLKVEDANVRSVTAWRKGFFNFDNASAPVIFSQLARWYGITVRYPAGIPTKRFDGLIGRDLNFDEVIKILDKHGLHCTLNHGEVSVLQDN
jgi:transmembrane sensor